MVIKKYKLSDVAKVEISSVDKKTKDCETPVKLCNFTDVYHNWAITTEMADVDGSYGENDSGIFFFTPDGRYIEWTGTYLYSDIPLHVDHPVVQIGGEVDE